MSLPLYLLFPLLKLFSLDPLDPSFGDRPAADLPIGVFTAHRPLQKVTKFKLALLPVHRLLWKWIMALLTRTYELQENFLSFWDRYKRAVAQIIVAYILL
jgi:hypothetical protein